MEENAIPAPAPANAKPCTLCTSNNTEKRKEKAEQPQKNSDMTTSYTEKTARKGDVPKADLLSWIPLPLRRLQSALIPLGFNAPYYGATYEH